MSENIIYCFSGSGNCLDMAKKIAAGLGDTDIVMMRTRPEITETYGYKRIGFVFPCYGGGLPGDVEKYIKELKISAGAYKFGVVQYAGYMGCGLHKIDELVGLDYWTGISNHSACIWLMPHTLTLPHTTLEEAQERTDKAAQKIAADVKAGVIKEKKPPRRILNAAESAGFGNVNKLISQKMSANGSCIGCGQCADICPKGNIRMVGGKPQFGSDCIGCLSCVQFCPKEAINVGTITEKRERFHNKNVTAADLTKKVIHID